MKKTFYVLSATALGILLSVIAHAALEKLTIGQLLSQGAVPVAYGYFGQACFLPPLFSYGILSAGAALGLILGFRWWDIVYVKKRRAFLWRTVIIKKRKRK
ncbi:MAG: hypothetical protein UY41_C0027G0009 [Candidatus Moranbacteria bacterium GW2011_GWE1_49_15]|nr:MAG: hypothetical protein UX75_C0058G0007 [Candidatus Moranbacteria bacterium GW2011_GWE2_47_10]KKW06390.1 MAG: hypothetical protein UY41_C0027G0009 [Candidatus Moranbacteria bacterium GW2011_GWE1_49_15]